MPVIQARRSVDPTGIELKGVISDVGLQMPTATGWVWGRVYVECTDDRYREGTVFSKDLAWENPQGHTLNGPEILSELMIDLGLVPEGDDIHLADPLGDDPCPPGAIDAAVLVGTPVTFTLKQQRNSDFFTIGEITV